MTFTWIDFIYIINRWNLLIWKEFIPNNVNLIFFNETQIYSVTLEPNFFPFSTPTIEYCSMNSPWQGTTQRKIEIFFDAKTCSCLSCLHVVMSLSKCMRKLPIQQRAQFWNLHNNDLEYLNSLAINKISFWPHIRWKYAMLWRTLEVNVS